MGSGGIDIATLADVAKDPQASQSVMGWLTEINKILGEANKTLAFAKNLGLSPEVLEKFIIQWRGLDKVPALPKSNMSVIPATATHKAVFEQLNNISDAELVALSKKMQETKEK